jgi:hypothetical protein
MPWSPNARSLSRKSSAMAERKLTSTVKLVAISTNRVSDLLGKSKVDSAPSATSPSPGPTRPSITRRLVAWAAALVTTANRTSLLLMARVMRFADPDGLVFMTSPSNCPNCGAAVLLPVQQPGRRICSQCGRKIARHDKWRVGSDGRLQHKNCETPTGQNVPKVTGLFE